MGEYTCICPTLELQSRMWCTLHPLSPLKIDSLQLGLSYRTVQHKLEVRRHLVLGMLQGEDQGMQVPCHHRMQGGHQGMQEQQTR